jgi:polyketide synthase PksN
MDNELNFLYSQIKEGKISHAEAAERLMALAAQPHEAPVAPGDGYGMNPECYTGDEPYVRDHTVQGECALLGVTYASLAINLFFTMFPQAQKGRIHSLNFITPVTIGKSQQAEILLDPQIKGAEIDFKVWYRYPPSDTWNLTALGHFQKTGAAERQSDLKKIKSNLRKSGDVNRIYSANPAVALGAGLRIITELYQGKDQVLAKVALRQTILDDNHEYRLHPLIINSAFIGASAFLPSDDGGNVESYLPFGINDLVFTQTDCTGECWLLITLSKNSGELITFDADLINGQSQVIASFLGCSLKKLRQGPENPDTYPVAPPECSAEPEVHTGAALAGIQKYLVDKLAAFVNDRAKLLNLDYNLMDMGLTSNQLVALTAEIGSETGIELNSTLFFEYPNINELAKFLTAEPQDAWRRLGCQAFAPIRPARPEPRRISGNLTPKKPGNLLRTVTGPEAKAPKGDIAVIGMHGLFAGAANLEQFWEALLQNNDLITEVPPDHWDFEPWYDPDPETADKTYCKWGSFIDDVAGFDAAFFNISPREAEWMDPQLRLLLQSVYSAAEDAGYINEVRGSNTGLYVGVCFHDYMDRIMESGLPVDPYIETGNAQTVIANRVSFLLNLTGPSLAIDTACSSSLFALHLACQALRNQECGMALVGGVNLLLSSYHYRYFSSIGALSPTGRCHSFDAAADGYVPGEGVASVLLKPLAQAQKDGDHIYAVIKGSAALHGGYTPSLTAPSVNGEENVILKAWENAGIHPETLSYVEAHGTGTKLGDPIEITSLQRAFRKFTAKSRFCAVGSIKANIGHTEGAAGIAGLLKVILQMKYGAIPVISQFKHLNPNIDLQDSAVYINREIVAWPGETGKPRRAGVSSFGFSGSYAHVVIEDYLPDGDGPAGKAACGNPAIIVLSAKSETQLRERAGQLAKALRERQLTDAHLDEIAYTLQMGREAMNVRLGVAVTSVSELLEKLGGYLDDRDSVSGLYRGQVDRANGPVSVLNTDEDLERLIDSWIVKRKYDKLLELWVKGLGIDWKKLYGERRFSRISLPVYPFAKERYWLPENSGNFAPRAIGKPAGSFIHPLLHRNTSDLTEQRFSSTFNGKEFFLANHVVNGYRILPGVAYLEMAREALSHSLGIMPKCQKGLRIKNVVWIQPVALRDSEAAETVEVHIGLYPGPNGEIAYEVYSRPDESSVAEAGEPVINSQGRLVMGPDAEIPALDLADLRKRCDRPAYTSKQWYDAIGPVYGRGFQGVESVYQCQDYTLAKLSLPESVRDTWDQFVLHPSLLDSAVQVPLILANLRSGEAALPFELQELVITRECVPVMWALVREGDEAAPGEGRRKFDLDLCDEDGNVCVRMKGLSSRALENRDGPPAASAGGTLMLEPVWNESVLPAAVAQPVAAQYEYEQYWLIWCEPDESIAESTCREIEERMKGIADTHRCLILQSRLKGPAARFIDYASRVFAEIQQFIKAKPSERLLLQIVCPVQGEPGLYSGLTGLLKTAALESPKIVGQLIEIDFGAESPSQGLPALVDKVKENRLRPLEGRIRYQDGQRMVAGWSETPLSAGAIELPWRDRGVYLITGGAGGIGRAITREILKHAKDATVILTGRSAWDRKKQDLLKEGEPDTAKVIYQAVDVTDKKAVTALIQHLHKEWGAIHGIIHGAGIIRDNYIINKDVHEFQEVLAPKVLGLSNLDKASKDLNLDWFVALSSLASQGNPGQADYAAANAFLDAYAVYRNALVRAGQRHGKTLAIAWPLWKDGGMRVAAAHQSLMMQNTGIAPMDTAIALRTLYQSLTLEKARVLALTGDTDRIRRKLSGPVSGLKSAGAALLGDSGPAAPDAAGLLNDVRTALARWVSQIQKIKISEIDPNHELNRFGFDSISFTRLANRLNKEYQLELTPALFFEHATLQRLAEFLVKEYPTELAARLARVTRKEETGAEAMAETVPSPLGRSARSRFAEAGGKTLIARPAPPEPIAIIGMSGKFPQAQDVDEFWRNLAAGKDCITEIPPERWDWKAIFGDPAAEVDKTNIKWGGFIDGVDEFDPLFFGISPREAELMDPQQRLLMTYVWHAIEDAGIAARTISGTRTAIFVGTGNSGYDRLLAQADTGVEAYSKTGVLPSVGPNRMSYFLNIHGPSEPIETACSSSLVAIHRAVTALESGGCALAIAGGVNTIITPEEHLSFSKAGMLCEDGRCKSFSDRANGYVRGEGVGMLVLKKLRDAVANGDHIYGIIRGTAENHGGRVNSLTAPNPKAQAELLIEAYTKAGIDPRTVTYIETHGTGTKLGDPIEINGLKAAFKALDQTAGHAEAAAGYCGLGSVKTNIGHLELASGIAGVIKVLLQIRAKTLAKSLHCETVNPYIQLEGSPFYIVRETREWPALQDAQGRDLPRRAGVSSFGFGGANAHVIIEEYLPAPESGALLPPRIPAMIVLSAQTEEGLSERARQLLAAIDRGPFSDDSLFNIAYTLQTGRDAMEERLGFVAASFDDMKAKLGDFVAGRDEWTGCYRGQVKRHRETLDLFGADTELQEAIDKWVRHGKYANLLELWVQGLDFDWDKLYPARPRRVSLPTYPFSKEHFWAPKAANSGPLWNRGAKSAVVHPLLHQNTSDFAEQRFSTVFTGREFFLKDHVVEGWRVLPGVVYLEMARAALLNSVANPVANSAPMRLKDVVWIQPVALRDQPEPDQPFQVHIGLYPKTEQEVEYEIYSRPSDAGANPGGEWEPIVHSQGVIGFGPQQEAQKLNIDSLVNECNQGGYTRSQWYEAIGPVYGPGLQGVERIYAGRDHTMAQLILPPVLPQTATPYLLHPSLMDAAVQVAILMPLMDEDPANRRVYLPFALDELEIHGRCAPKMWARIRNSGDNSPAERVRKYDIDLCDPEGNIQLKMRGLSARVLEGEIASTVLPDSQPLVFEPCWKPRPLIRNSGLPDTPPYDYCLVMLCEPGQPANEPGFPGKVENLMREVASACRCLVWQSGAGGRGERFQSCAGQAFAAIKEILEGRPGERVLVQIVVGGDNERQLWAGLAGLLKTARLESSRFVGQLVEVDSGTAISGENIERLGEKLRGDALLPEDCVIRYQGDQRMIAAWNEITDQAAATETVWKDEGIYLISGGIGGLGLLAAEEIADRARRTTLVLIARSAPTAEQQTRIAGLESRGARIVVKPVDVTDPKAVNGLIESIRKDWGNLNGIIHCAGLIRDALITKKTVAEFLEVMAPKVAGLENLDYASKTLDLDCFVIYSSLSGCLGNPGQADYAAANAFMNEFAEYRQRLVALKLRKGVTVSIGWPLWKEGGMRIDAATERLIYRNWGLVPLETRPGMKLLRQGLALGRPQIMVMAGDHALIRRNLRTAAAILPPNGTWISAPTASAKIDTGELAAKVVKSLTDIGSEILKLKTDRISGNVELSQLGFDSITLTEFANKLNQRYGLRLTPTVLFEYPTLQAFSEFLASKYPSSFSSELDGPEGIGSAALQAVQPSDYPVFNQLRTRFAGNQSATSVLNGPEAIAIVGMSGTFPMANDLDAFWDNLLEGKDCIREIPEERWDWREYYGDPFKEENKTNIKWGGFIDGAAEFDPLFFGISPREAELMDPQQRLLMTYVWKAIEDAGYSAQSLAGTKTGILVGTINSGYGGLIARSDMAIEGNTAIGTVPSVGPNRMSYFLDIHGPSEPIETACSSSLVAIHRAVNAIANGTCDMAIAGGVNTIITPDIHISFNKAGMLCEDGRCKTFSQQANGYVRGEGVGMIFLKKLKAAEAAGDHIYAVIRGTAENHGGRANSLTAPNPKAQTDLLLAAYTRAGIDPRTVTYIEAHGTGTALGDPIEIDALKNAFEQLYQVTGDPEVRNRHCGLGSVKSNIGHLELAAGIAGVIKVLLQLKHKTLVKSIHCETVNPYIQLEDSPFYIVNETRAWNSLYDEQGRIVPRRAGVSSFGFGGVNAHVILEEYLPAPQGEARLEISGARPAIIVLSAKNEERLKEQVRQLLLVIEAGRFADSDLADMAYTLQVGREALEERLGVMVVSIQEIAEKIRALLDNWAQSAPDIYRGRVKLNNHTLTAFAADEDMEKTIDAWITKKKYAKILELWVNGLSFDWNKLYGARKPRRISLPTYPFAKERYWVRGKSRPERSLAPSIAANDWFDADFYERLIDAIIDNTLSIDGAVAKTGN